MKRRRFPLLIDTIAPTPERRTQGAVEQLRQPIADESGAPARPFRAIDTLAMMERRGSITAGMRQAGEDFRAKFNIAQLDPLRAGNYLRTPGGGIIDAPHLKIEAAREHVWRALRAVGGIASPAGSALWHIVGWERTIREWALLQNWSQRRIDPEQASGILIAALGMLEAHYRGA